MAMPASVRTRIMNPQLLQLVVITLVALLGLTTALRLNVHGFEHSLGYMYIAFGLLCFGLYMAAFGIDLTEVRRHWRMVFIALTIGVLAKYVIIATTSVVVMGDWSYAVLAMAVAQIDPLSVSALNDDQRMSPHTKTVLNMWASFDDPVTALATPLILGVVASMGRLQSVPATSVGDLVLQLGPFVLAVALMAYVILWQRFARKPLIHATWLEDVKVELGQHEAEGVKTSVMHLLVAVACIVKCPSISALTGLFIRPQWLAGRFGVLLLRLALAGAAFLLGILLSGGANWYGGFVLGIATYVSQIVVGWGVVGLDRWLSPGDAPEDFSIRDVWHLALAQQNGITAVVLALVLEISIPSAVATIAPMIVVVAGLQLVANAVFDIVGRRIWPERVELSMTND